MMEYSWLCINEVLTTSLWNLQKFLTTHVEYIRENRHIKNYKPAWCNEMGTESVTTDNLISKGGYYEHDGCKLIFLSQKNVL